MHASTIFALRFAKRLFGIHGFDKLESFWRQRCSLVSNEKKQRQQAPLDPCQERLQRFRFGSYRHMPRAQNRGRYKVNIVCMEPPVSFHVYLGEGASPGLGHVFGIKQASRDPSICDTGCLSIGSASPHRAQCSGLPKIRRPVLCISCSRDVARSVDTKA